MFVVEGKRWSWWKSASGKWSKVPLCKTKAEHHYFLGQGSIKTSMHIRCSKLGSSWNNTEISHSKDTDEIFDSKDKEQISDCKDTEQIPPTKVVVVDEEEEGSEGESF